MVFNESDRSHVQPFDFVDFLFGNYIDHFNKIANNNSTKKWIQKLSWFRAIINRLI